MPELQPLASQDQSVLSTNRRKPGAEELLEPLRPPPSGSRRLQPCPPKTPSVMPEIRKETKLHTWKRQEDQGQRSTNQTKETSPNPEWRVKRSRSACSRPHLYPPLASDRVLLGNQSPVVESPLLTSVQPIQPPILDHQTTRPPHRLPYSGGCCPNQTPYWGIPGVPSCQSKSVARKPTRQQWDRMSPFYLLIDRYPPHIASGIIVGTWDRQKTKATSYWSKSTSYSFPPC